MVQEGERYLQLFAVCWCNRCQFFDCQNELLRIFLKGNQFFAECLQPRCAKRVLSRLANDYSTFLEFVKISIHFENFYAKRSDFDQISEDADLEDFFYEFCPDCGNFEDLFDETHKTEVKLLQKITLKKFRKIVPFVYTRIMQFPDSNFQTSLLKPSLKVSVT